MKEMVGGCCVCSDDRGWTENPLVYCDGQGCTVAVHQACYGIVTVPSGPWFCRKCESQERAARVRCELCPSKDGALKRTDSTGWAHVICALYIPEIRFGNVATMEPIILSMVPPDRYNKSCCICESQGKESKSKIGACMNCNKPGCKLHFHVTCAQAMGLLCEEAGNYMDNVKYCGYCPHHYSKLKKGANLKTIPAFKPLPNIGIPSDLNSEKSNSSQAGGSNWNGQSSGATNGTASKDKSRKKPGRKSNQTSPKTSNSRDSALSSVIVDGSNTLEDPKTKSSKSEVISYSNVLAGVGLVPGPRLSVLDQTTSNIEKHEPNDAFKPEDVRSSETIKSSAIRKTEKTNESFKPSTASGPNLVPPPVPNFLSLPEKSRTARRKGSTRSVTPTSQGGNDTESTLSNVSDSCTPAAEGMGIGELKKGRLAESVVKSEANPSVLHSVIVSSAAAYHPESAPIQIEPSQPVPHRAVSPLIISTSAAASGSSHVKNDAKSNFGSVFQNAEKDSLDAPVPAKKPRRGRTPKVNAPVVPDSPPSSPDSVSIGADQPPKRKKRASKNAPVEKHPLNSAGQLHLTAAVSRAEGFLVAHLNQQQSVNENVTRRDDTPSFNSLTRESSNAGIKTGEKPVSATEPSLTIHTATKDLHPHKDNSISSGSKESNIFLHNGMTAPHMLGNQLNPNSSVAQKMTDTLAAELEAHGVGSRSSPLGPSFTGVPFPVRSVSPSLRPNVPTGSSGATPETMEELLALQFEQTSQFLMEQAHAHHFDIASLLSCLNKLRQENMKLEDHVANLSRRRDQLLATQARLSVPFTNSSVPDRSTPGTAHASGPGLIQQSSSQERERNNRGTPFLPSMENGMGLSEHSLAAYMGTTFSSPHGSHRSSASSSHQSDRVIPSPVIVSSRMNPVYSSGGSLVSAPSTMSPVQGSSSFLMENRNISVLRSPSSTPEIRSDASRSTATPSQISLYPYQIVSPPPSVPTHHPGSYASIASAMSNVGTNQHGMIGRRDAPDPRHHLGRPNSIERR